MGTTWRWPWRLESAKKCVTTYRSNLPALKMEGAEEREWKGLYCWIMEIRRKEEKEKKKEKKNKSPYVGGAWRKWRNEWRGMVRKRGGGWTSFFSWPDKYLFCYKGIEILEKKEKERIWKDEELESKKRKLENCLGWRNLIWLFFSWKTFFWIESFLIFFNKFMSLYELYSIIYWEA